MIRFVRLALGGAYLAGACLLAGPAKAQDYYSFYKSVEWRDASGNAIGGQTLACPLGSTGTQGLFSWGSQNGTRVLLDRGLCDPILQKAQLFGFTYVCHIYVTQLPAKPGETPDYWYTSDCPDTFDAYHPLP